jgi:hypothetical protein
MSAAKRQQRTKRIPGYTPEAETAEELNISIHTLRKWRQLRVGPPWVQIGRQIHYPDDGRAAWIRSREVHPDELVRPGDVKPASLEAAP